MTNKSTKYLISLVVILLGAFGQLRAHSGHFAAIPTANTVSTDESYVVNQEERLFIIKPYTPQFEKQVKIEVTNIEDEDEDELNHDGKLSFSKKYVELGQFLNNITIAVFTEQIPSFYFSRTFSPISVKSLNIAFCIFRI